MYAVSKQPAIWPLETQNETPLRAFYFFLLLRLERIEHLNMLLASVFNIYVVFVCTYSAPRKRFNGLLMSFPGKYTEWRVCTAPNHRPQFGTPFDRRRFGKYVSFLLLRHLISRWHHILFALYSLATTHSFIDAIRPIEHSPFATCARVPFVSRSCIDISCGYIIIGQL